MPRGNKKRCPKNCNNLSPCPLPGHERGWQNYQPKHNLPSNWAAIVRFVKKRDRGCCRFCGSKDSIEIDHIIERADWPDGQPGLNDPSNLRCLCKSCHKAKGQEAARLRRKKNER